METGKQETNGKTLKNGKQYYDLSNTIIFFTSNIEIEDKKTNLGFAMSVENDNLGDEDESENITAERNIARIIGRETKDAKEKLAATGRFKRETARL